MISVVLCGEDCDGRLCEVMGSFPRLGRLRDMQLDLCRKFRNRFPSKMATVKVEGHLYDRFNDQPFTSCPDGAAVDVSFGPIDDPYFHDFADRRPCPSLEEEVQWEEAVAAGETTLDLVTWVNSRRGSHQKMIGYSLL